MKYAILNNGVKMPMAGIGTFLLSPMKQKILSLQHCRMDIG